MNRFVVIDVHKIYVNYKLYNFLVIRLHIIQDVSLFLFKILVNRTYDKTYKQKLNQKIQEVKEQRD
jgi:hypothetical protein